MYRYKIELVTQSDIRNFVDIASKHAGVVRLLDSTGFCVSGKSLLGAMYTIEWNDLWCESDEDMYPEIERFVK